MICMQDGFWEGRDWVLERLFYKPKRQKIFFFSRSCFPGMTTALHVIEGGGFFLSETFYSTMGYRNWIPLLTFQHTQTRSRRP